MYVRFSEYVPGGSISGCIRAHGRFGETTTKSFIKQILSGLAYLHSMGIIHRVRAATLTHTTRY